jgi:hypothetical protein
VLVTVIWVFRSESLCHGLKVIFNKKKTRKLKDEIKNILMKELRPPEDEPIPEEDLNGSESVFMGLGEDPPLSIRYYNIIDKFPPQKAS